MGVRYDRGIVGRCKQADLCPVTIAIGREIEWQGGVSREVQLHLLELLQSCQRDFPPSALPEVRVRVKSALPVPSLNGTPVTPDTVVDPTPDPLPDMPVIADPPGEPVGSHGRKNRR